MKVSELLNKYGSDKESYHRYGTGCYDALFLPYKHKGISLLEIGVYYGSSLKAWQEFFPKAIITGVDNESKDDIDEGINIVIADAYNDETVKLLDINAYYDIIIDDGPHGLVNQRQCLEKYWPLLAWGGLMIIEDIEHDADLKALNEIRPYDFTTHTINIGGAVNSRLAVWVKH